MSATNFVSIIFVSAFLALCDARLNRLLFQKHGTLGEPSGVMFEKLPSDQWFEQKLDHFNIEEPRTWKQR
jgi:hypothetical protein